MRVIFVAVAILGISGPCFTQKVPGSRAGCSFQPPNILTDGVCFNRLRRNPTYRPINGSLATDCSPTGRSFEVYGRLGAPYYADCKSEFRDAKSGRPLESVRKVVNGVFRDFKRELTKEVKVPNLIGIWIGQYLAHDLGSRRFTLVTEVQSAVNDAEQ